eukprot:4719600-Prorocentrum_lima.AAC.1
MSGVRHSLQNASSFQQIACVSPCANLTTALPVPEAFLGRVVSGSRNCDAPESHVAKGSPGSFINALCIVLPDRQCTESACNCEFTLLVLSQVDPVHQ